MHESYFGKSILYVANYEISKSDKQLNRVT